AVVSDGKRRRSGPPGRARARPGAGSDAPPRIAGKREERAGAGHPESRGQATAAPARAWLTTERIAWALGLALVAYWGVWYVAGVAGQREGGRQFALLRPARARSLPQPRPPT